MRADFILPALLAIALLVMVGYAATDGSDPLPSTAIRCEQVRLGQLPGLREASGLAASRRTPQLFWTHNDSASPHLYGVNAEAEVGNGVRVNGAAVTDWEAITSAPCDGGSCLFIGDIGDNDRARPSVVVFRVPEPAAGDAASAQAVRISAVYPEGPQDAEALFVVGGELYLITKGDDAPIRLYRFPALTADRTHTLQLVTTLYEGDADEDLRVTDAAASPDERWVAVRSNTAALFYESRALLAGTPGTPLQVDLRELAEPQGEGIAWVDEGTLLLAGEGERGGTLARISCNLPR